jgi:hypothetical protein
VNDYVDALGRQRDFSNNLGIGGTTVPRDNTIDNWLPWPIMKLRENHSTPVVKLHRARHTDTDRINPGAAAMRPGLYTCKANLTQWISCSNIHKPGYGGFSTGVE